MPSNLLLVSVASELKEVFSSLSFLFFSFFLVKYFETTGSFPPHFLEKVIEDAKTAYKKWTKIESVAPIIQYPSEFPSSPSPSPSSPPPSSSDCFETTISLCVYHPANPSLPQTTFFQGWMFDGEIEQGRLGVSRYPLIGLYQNNHGFLFPSSSSPSSPSSSSKGGEESSNELSEFSPMNSLSPADQHVHLVEETLELDGFLMELKDWNFGGPMAKLVLNPEQLSLNPHSNVASGLVACVDLKRKRIHLCGLFVVCGERPKESIDRQFLMKQSTGLLKDFIETLPRFDPQIGL